MAEPEARDPNATEEMPAAGPDIARYRWFILLGLITAAIMEVLDTTIINVALPQMAGNLGATREEIAWVATSYILANVVVLPMTAFFTAVFGRKRYLTFSIILFVVASFLCGTSHSLGEIVLWRLLQGAGGAALLSTAQATLRQIFPREQQGLVQAIFLLGVIVAPTLGPTLGGWITDNYTWNWCFFINIPIGIASAFLVSTFLHDPPAQKRRTGPVDWFGIGLLIIGVGALQYVLEEGNRKDWFADPLIIELSILSAVSLVALVWWQLSKRNGHPVIEFRVLKNRDLSASIFLFIVLGFGLYGGTFLFPLFTQTILGFTPTETGLTMMPGGLATACVALLCGFLLNGKKPLADARVLILCGMALMLLAMWTLGGLTTVAGEADARIPLIIRGGALGLLFTPINNAAFGAIEALRGAAGLGPDQSLAPARRFVRHRGARHLLTRHIAIHRADLVTNLYAGNPLYDQRYHGTRRRHDVARRLHGRGAAAGARHPRRHGDAAGVDAGVQRCWWLILVCFACVAPAVFLLHKPSARRVMTDAH